MAKSARARIAARLPTPTGVQDAKMISRPNVGMARPDVADVHGEEAAAPEVPQQDRPTGSATAKASSSGDRRDLQVLDTGGAGCRHLRASSRCR